jgi:hypothetical protein
MGVEPKSVESYFDLVKSTAPTLKAANKNAVVLAGAATSEAMRNGWVIKLIKLGVLKYVDGVSIHPYIHCEHDNRPETWFNYVSDFSDKLKKANSGMEVPLYITEMGWPSHKGACATSPEKVAEYLVRSLLLIRTLPAVKGFWWYDLKNDGTKVEEMEHNFGLLGYDYAPKPAVNSLRDIAPIIVKGKVFSKLKTPFGLIMIAVTDDHGEKSFAIWSENGNRAKVEVAIVPSKSMSPSFFKIGSGNPSRTALSKTTSVLTADGMPLLISGVQSVVIDKVTW